MTTPNKTLDVICLGRSSVDLYGQQIGTRLEDTLSFAKWVGGCPTNVAVGTRRLGLKSGLITRVGDEQLGSFIVETLVKEGVDTSGITRDPDRLTALVILGIRDQNNFPHIFYRPDCADMALTDAHIDEAYIASAQALLITGTHVSAPGVEAASLAAMRYARQNDTRIVFDIDYRPSLWGLAGHASGENRFIASAAVTERLLRLVPDCDLVVGTEEEIHIAGGSEDTLTALRTLRNHSDATLVLKRGPLGCVIFDGAIPSQIEDGVVCQGNAIEVFNTLGAGDGFLSGFLRGWIRNEALETCGAWANATGALVVSRNGCAPAMPSWEEMQAYLSGRFPGPRLQEDTELAHLHKVTNRHRHWPQIAAFAFDHRSQFETLAASCGVGPDRISRFKDLCVQAAESVAQDVPGAGVIIDSKYGAAALARLSGGKVWIARPVELPGSRPLAFEAAGDIGLHLNTWPEDHVVKCLALFHPDDPADIHQHQMAQIALLYSACLETGRELLLEIIPPEGSRIDATTVPRAMTQIYDRGIRPDWWKLPPAADAAAWTAAGEVIRSSDPKCRGIVVLGLNAPTPDLARSFAAAAQEPLCKGFAVGRSIFWDAAEKWFSGRASDAEIITEVASRYRELATIWRDARAGQDSAGR